MVKGIVICFSVIGVLALIAFKGLPTDRNEIDPGSKGIMGMEDSNIPDSSENTALTRTQTRKAYISPETGELTSVPPPGSKGLSPADAVQADLNLPPVKITTHSDGTVQAELNGRFRTPLTATIDCDGKIVTEHSEHGVSEATDCEAK